MGQTTATRDTGRLNKIGNFYVDRIDDKVMRDYAKSEGIEIDGIEGMSAEQLGVALTLHFQGVADRDDMCKCADCGGEAPDSVSPCPFCGLDGEVHDEAEVEADGEAPDDGAPPDAPSEPAVEAKDVEVVGEAKRKPGRPKKSAAANGKATNGITHLKGKGPALASTKHTEKDLDKAIGEVFALKTGAVHSFLDLGKKILEINEKQLWRLRVDEKGKARYSGFDAFVTHELAMTPGQAYDLMRQVQEYTPEDIVRLGRSKISLLLKAPPDFREELKKEVEKTGMPHRKLAEKVKEARKKTGYEGDNQQSKAGAAGGKAKAKKHAEKTRQHEKITVAQIEGRKTVKLFAKPASLRNVDLSTCKRAKAIGDQPFGQLALTNEVVMNITIQKTDAGLVAVIDTRRDTSE